MGNPCLRSNNMLIVYAMMLPRHEFVSILCTRKNSHKKCTQKYGKNWIFSECRQRNFPARRHFFAWQSAGYRPMCEKKRKAAQKPLCIPVGSRTLIVGTGIRYSIH